MFFWILPRPDTGSVDVAASAAMIRGTAPGSNDLPRADTGKPVHHQFGSDMEHRRSDQPVAVLVHPALGDHGQPVDVKPPLAEHHAFGKTRCAGSINQCGQIIRFNLVL